MNIWKCIYLHCIFQMMMTAAQNTTETYFLPIQRLCVIMRLRLLWNHWPLSIEMIPVDMMPRLKLLDPIEIACFYHKKINFLSTKVHNLKCLWYEKADVHKVVCHEYRKHTVFRNQTLLCMLPVEQLLCYDSNIKVWHPLLHGFVTLYYLLHTPKYNEIAI